MVAGFLLFVGMNFWSYGKKLLNLRIKRTNASTIILTSLASFIRSMMVELDLVTLISSRPLCMLIIAILIDNTVLTDNRRIGKISTLI